uniref:Lipase n=1 Tax=Acrobeloides nanus TaxID=290746 RepID=A0A914DC45_9BILA
MPIFVNVGQLIRILVWNLSFCLVVSLVTTTKTDDYPLGPITENFKTWLDWNGYGLYNFSRTDLGKSGSFGGKDYSAQLIVNRPVVLIHGNSDGALTAGPTNIDGSKNVYGTGWTKTIQYFMQQGYSTAELYATTWGNRNATWAYTRTHSCSVILRLRKFVEAVLQYTKVQKISVISHSMGVGVARKVIRGGIIEEPDGTSCDVGESLRDKIEVFIGISGANYGMCQCGGAYGEGPPIWPTCNAKTGFWPGAVCSHAGNCWWYHNYCQDTSYSQILQEMNEDPHNEAEHVFAWWCHEDELIGNHGQVFGRPTSYIPFNNGTKVFPAICSPEVPIECSNHMETKDSTVDFQYHLISALK